MTNYKIGMRVYHFLNMHKPGTITELKTVKSKEWMIGGTAQQRLLATVRHDDDTHSKYWASDLRIED